jgi:hypothetical protein
MPVKTPNGEEMNKKIQERGVVSFPKSGRTWIRLFYQYYSNYTGARSKTRVVFRHEDKPEMKRRVLLIRHPCDVMVSNYMHKKMRRRTKQAVGEFIRNENRGLPLHNKLLTEWSKRTENQMVVRYEDLFEPDEWLRIFDFFETPFQQEAFDKAFENTKFENIRDNLEEIATFPSAWRYLAAEHGKYNVIHPKNPESHKFRRGMVGGYVDYIGQKTVNYILDNFTFGENLEEYAEQYRQWSKSLNT